MICMVTYEWVNDIYGGPYAESSVIDPQGSSSFTVTRTVVVHFILRLKALGLPGEDPNHPILKIGQNGLVH